MKSIEDTLAYIQNYFDTVLAQPDAHFRNVDAMENELLTMEQLRCFIVDDAKAWPILPKEYYDFMYERGYGTLGFSHGKWDHDAPTESQLIPVKGPTVEETKKMHELSRLWQDYRQTFR